MKSMLIGSKFKRPNAPVNLPTSDGKSTNYYFRPRDPLDPTSEHVCVVENKQHIATLLKIEEGYYIADDEEAAADEVKRPSAASTEETTEVKTDIAPVAKTDTTGPVDTAAVVALLALSLGEFKKAIGAKTTPSELLTAALSAEKSKGDDERPTYTKALEDQLTKLAKPAKAA